jgi:hypothetical protein
LNSSFLFFCSLISFEPECCVLELFGWMSELKMLIMGQTLETYKKGIKS